MAENILAYELHNVAAADLEREIDSIWNDLQAPGRTRDAAIARGIPIDELPERQQAVTFTADKAGFTSVETAIIVAFAPVIAKVARDLWDHIILPRLLQRFGQTALKRK